MDLAAKYLATLLVVFIVAVHSFLGRRRYRQLMQRVRTDPSVRKRYYVRGIISTWLYVGVVIVIVILAGGTAGSIGLTIHHLKPDAMLFSVELVVMAAIGLVVSTVSIRRPGSRLVDRFRRQLQPFVELLPRTREEHVGWSVVG